MADEVMGRGGAAEVSPAGRRLEVAVAAKEFSAAFLGLVAVARADVATCDKALQACQKLLDSVAKRWRREEEHHRRHRCSCDDCCRRG